MLFGIFKKNKGKHKLSYEDIMKGKRVRMENSERKQELRRIEYETIKRMSELKLRRQELEVAKLEEELSEYQQEYEQEEQPQEQSNDADSMLMNLLTPFIAMQTTKPSTSSQETTPPKQELGLVSFTDEQIKEIWKDIPKLAKKAAKSMNDEQLRAFIKNKEPSVDDESISRAIKIIRTD